MISRARLLLAALVLFSPACKATPPPSTPPPSTPASSSPPPASVTASAPAPAPPAPPPAPPVATAPPDVSTAPVSAVVHEITTPAVVSPDAVISTLRPKFNACFSDALKKDPKTTGTVTLSAKIEKDGKVSAVTPKLLAGFSPAVVKCLSDRLKAATFAAAGGMNYTTSLDIPLSFTANQ